MIVCNGSCSFCVTVYCFPFLTEGPPISPKPIALISPEKLPFRDRRALYEKNVDPNKDDNRKEFRKSWAPGMLSPRSGSTSPIHTKWPSSSSVGITPTYRG